MRLAECRCPMRCDWPSELTRLHYPVGSVAWCYVTPLAPALPPTLQRVAKRSRNYMMQHTVAAVAPCCNYMLQLHAATTRCNGMLQLHAATTCCNYMLQRHAARIHFILAETQRPADRCRVVRNVSASQEPRHHGP